MKDKENLLPEDGEYRRNFPFAPQGHTLCLGAAGTGKTRRFMIPLVKSLLEAGESCIILDSGEEIYRRTLMDAGENYRIHKVDPGNIPRSDSFNLLTEAYELFTAGGIAEKAEASRILQKLSFLLFPDPLQGDSFWNQAARSLFLGAADALMTLGKPEEINMAGLYRMITEGEDGTGNFFYMGELIEMLDSNSPGAIFLKEFISMPKETRSEVKKIFCAGLSPFLVNAEMMCLVSGDDLNMGSLDGRTPAVIYISCPGENPLSCNLAGILCRMLLFHYMDLARKNGEQKLPCRLNLCMEDCGILSVMEDLPRCMHEAGSLGIRFHLAVKSFSQLEMLYGRNGAQEVYDNTSTVLAFRLNHGESLRILGERWEAGEGKDQISPRTLGTLETGHALLFQEGTVRDLGILPDFTELSCCEDPPLCRWEKGPLKLPQIFEIRRRITEHTKEFLQKALEKEKQEEARKKELRDYIAPWEKEDVLTEDWMSLMDSGRGILSDDEDDSPISASFEEEKSDADGDPDTDEEDSDAEEKEDPDAWFLRSLKTCHTDHEKTREQEIPELRHEKKHRVDLLGASPEAEDAVAEVLMGELSLSREAAEKAVRQPIYPVYFDRIEDARNLRDRILRAGGSAVCF